ncbi:helix-turn-helix domain-containing protein [Pyxidicoccus xibeiensis]|uniref:helix-turn-helix domain-containing protein n=1 Tax=Pyxidicoccus xibeiensis TaxID=2906759 RepID=UPI0020A78556|nr:helix-turn-helix domain-containing protein [Pyxidicoccus xibeiensis]MCP3135929.1 helix-turn-helix domain-containing protein [Pyxidicoccus xibeiensis]
MSQDFYTAEQVADLLDLHVRTVRAYVRDGRLKATRIGKQYRIAREAIEALTGHPLSAPEPVRRHRHVEVSSIVEIDAIAPEAAMRIANGVVAAANGRDPGEGPLRVDTLYSPERARLKLILTGPLADTTRLLQLVNTYLEGAS